MESIPVRKLSKEEQVDKLQIEVEALKELVDGEPEAFFILVGAMKWNEQKGRYENGAFGDPDENSKLSTGTALATGGKDRILAAAELHKVFPQADIVAMSKTRDETKPTYAQVAAGELIQKGVDPEQIMLEEVSVSTVTEYKEAAKIWKEKAWKRIAFITSNWHVPRSRALLNTIENFADSQEELVLLTEFADAIRSGALAIQFIGSTEVLEIRSPHYKKLFAEIEDFSGIQERSKAEQNALDQLAAGTYGGKQLTKKIGMSHL